MKKKTEGDDSSRRGFIKGTVGGVAVSLVANLTPVAKALQSAGSFKRERELINCTIGETTRQLMDSSVRTSPDMVAIYREIGGNNPFTLQLLAETFGSSSAKREGVYVLQPGTPPDFNRLNAALVSKARALAAQNTGRSRGQAPVTVTDLRKGQPGSGKAVYRIGIDTGDITINC